MRNGFIGIAGALALSLSVFGCGDDDQGSAGSGGSSGSGGTGGAFTVEETPLIGTLEPYNEGGATLFPPDSVEAHWYQWDGVYVVLYRGYDATDPSPLCPGNSIFTMSAFANVSNAPYPADEAEACEGAPNITDTAASCERLLYYVTQIPVTQVGDLFGTLELSTDEGFIGQSSVTATITPTTDVPEFEPGLTAYELPESTVDPSGTVTCVP